MSERLAVCFSIVYNESGEWVFSLSIKIFPASSAEGRNGKKRRLPAAGKGGPAMKKRLILILAAFLLSITSCSQPVVLRVGPVPPVQLPSAAGEEAEEPLPVGWKRRRMGPASGTGTAGTREALPGTKGRATGLTGKGTSRPAGSTPKKAGFTPGKTGFCRPD